MSVNQVNEKDYQFDEDSFKLVQIDKKIHDVKFETKPTTFAKDAFKRFVKNRSSVVGAIIIGILVLLALFVPLFSPFDIKTNHNEQSLLPPKLFEAGTGWWDGTKKYENVVWDAKLQKPAGDLYRADCVISKEVTNIEYTTDVNDHATGGYIHLIADGKINSEAEKYSKVGLFRNATPIKITKDGGYQVTITLGNEELGNGLTPAEYKVRLVSGSRKIDLTEWAKPTSEAFTIDLSKALADNNIDSLEKTYLEITVTKDVKLDTYLLVKSIVFTSTTNDPEVDKLLSEISINDAVRTLELKAEGNNKFPTGFWRSTFKRSLHKAEIQYVNFVYDTYKSKLNLVNKIIGGSEIQQYIDNGWIEYDFAVGPSSFKILNEEKSPVKQVFSQNYSEELKIYNIECEVYNYRYLGMDSIPKFLFGTNLDGKDLVTVSFNSLRTSLLIAIVVAAICFMFGLCWGSISGYFGGNIDLAMERFCEILGGVPYIVVMTLIILLCGNSIFIFGLGLCITGWMGTAARTRTQFYRFKGREYVLASRTLGASDKRLIFKHILPNALGTIVTSSVLMVPGVIFSEATLAYLNLGLKGVDSFGVLLSDNQNYLSTFPMLIIFPAIIISLLMISFNLFGNGLRDALNPSLKGSE